MQISMWNQYLVQLLTHNPRSINAKVFRTLRTLRTTKKVFLDFLMSELVGVCSTPLHVSTDSKTRMMNPWLEWFPENIGLPENLWILRPKRNPPWTSLQTNLRNKNFVWNYSTLIFINIKTWIQLHECPRYL